MGVSLNGGTPQSSISIGFSIINHPLWGTTILGNPQMVVVHADESHAPQKNTSNKNQLMVNCWSGMRIGRSLSNNPFH